MSTLQDATPGKFIKLILAGDSGTGKTGALASLVCAGYDLRILDLDNGLPILAALVKEKCPKRLESVQYHTFQDKLRPSPTGMKVAGRPEAFIKATMAMDKWPEDGTNPADWGEKKIFVLDSLTSLAQAAFRFAEAQNPGVREPRQIYAHAQKMIANVLEGLFGPSFQTNVIVLAHIDRGEDSTGLPTEYISTIGRALGPKIPRYINTLLVLTMQGTKSNVKRTIHTVPTSRLGVKHPMPGKLKPEYPQDTGLAEIFKTLHG